MKVFIFLSLSIDTLITGPTLSWSSSEVDVANAKTKSLESFPLFSFDLTEIHIVSIYDFIGSKGMTCGRRRQHFKMGAVGI